MLRPLVNPPVDLTKLIRVSSVTRLDQRPAQYRWLGLHAFSFQIAHEVEDAFLTGTSFAEYKGKHFWHTLDAQMQQRDSAYL